jgi:Peptidase C13 family
MVMRFTTTLLGNLAGGLRLLLFAPVARAQFEPSLRQAVLLAGLAGVVWFVFDRLVGPDQVYFQWVSVAQVAWLAVIALGVLLLLTPAGRDPESAALALTAIAAVAPGYLIVVLSVLTFSKDTPFQPWAGYVVAALSAVYLVRIARLLPASFPAAVVTGLVVVAATWIGFNESVFSRPLLWKAKDDAGRSAAAAEEAMFRQPTLIEAAVRDMAPQTPGKTDVYFVGFAGDGKQAVFGKEVTFARDALARKLELGDRRIELVNTPQLDAETPIASGAGLRYALSQVGEAMNPEEDVLLLFMTSHGTPRATLSVFQPGWPLEDLSAPTLASALREAGIKWRIVIISACYSGSFIDSLKDDHTLIVTAARADRKSFGCRDNSELTYYGEALFRDAMPQSRSLLDAVAQASAVVTDRERVEEIEPSSEPQTWVGEKMRAKLEEIDWRESLGTSAQVR